MWHRQHFAFRDFSLRGGRGVLSDRHTGRAPVRQLRCTQRRDHGEFELPNPVGTTHHRQLTFWLTRRRISFLRWYRPFVFLELRKALQRQFLQGMRVAGDLHFALTLDVGHAAIQRVDKLSQVPDELRIRSGMHEEHGLLDPDSAQTLRRGKTGDRPHPLADAASPVRCDCRSFCQCIDVPAVAVRADARPCDRGAAIGSAIKGHSRLPFGVSGHSSSRPTQYTVPQTESVHFCTDREDRTHGKRRFASK